MRTSKRLKLVDEYIFSKLAKAKAAVEKKTGKKVLDLSIGSPDIRPSPIYMKEFARLILEDSSHLYPGYGAIPEFKKALKKWYKKRFGVDLADGGVIPLLGAKEGVSYLPLALLDEGSEVLVPDPGYPAFSGPARLMGAKLVNYDASREIDVKELEKKTSPKTVFLWVNMPANPTGMVGDLKKLKELVDFAKRKNIWLVYDNAYSEITFDGYRAPSILEVKGAEDVAVEIGSFSKSHSFAGYRMGWMVGSRDLIKALSKIKSQFDSGMSRPLQKLAAFALEEPDKNWHKEMIAEYNKRRDIISANLVKIGLEVVKPKGGLYLWVKIPNGFKDTEEFTFNLLEKRQILVAPGTAFGKNGKRYIRVSISSNINNIKSYFVFIEDCLCRRESL